MNWIPIDSTEHERRMALWRQMENMESPNWIELSAIYFAPSITVEELIERYAAGERNFIDISLPHKADLTGINLAGAILLGARFNYSNLTRANLSSADLRYAWIRGNFTEANLEEANIERADAAGTIFRKANLFNTVGWFGIECGAWFEDTIMRDGRVVSYEGRA